MEPSKDEVLKQEASQLVTECKAIVIVENKKYILKDEQQREIAGILLIEAADLEKKIKAHYKPMEDANREAGKKIKEAKDGQLKGPQEAKGILSQGIGEFDARAKREAEEKARIEREKIEAERLAEIERKEEEAKKLEAEGKEEAAELARQEAEEILDLPEPVVEVAKPEKLSGIKQVRYVKCEIADEIMLRRHILNQIKKGEAWEELLKPNEPAVRAYIKQLSASKSIAELNTFPGVRVWEEYKASSTGR